jgi:hypothetical protein
VENGIQATEKEDRENRTTSKRTGHKGQELQPCVRPPLGSNPGASQREMDKFGLDELATDPTYVKIRKWCSYGN